MSEPQLRANVRRGLLKAEPLHALACAVYFGQRGRITAREVYDHRRPVAASVFPFDPELITHVNPKIVSLIASRRDP